MAISRILGQDANATTGTSPLTATYTSPPTRGNLLVGIAGTQDGAGARPVTPPGWSTASIWAANNSSCVLIFYKVAGISESQSVTVTDPGFNIDLAIYEYTGFIGTPAFDQSGTGGGTSVNNILIGSPTTTNANELLIAGAATLFGATLTSWSSGFNTQQTVHGTLFTADQVVSATSTYSTTITWTTNQTSSGALATFFDNTASTTHTKFNNSGLRPHPFSPGLAR